jgi:hypothetical protein
MRIHNTGKKCVLEESWRLAAVSPGPLLPPPPGPGHAREGQVPSGGTHGEIKRSKWRQRSSLNSCKGNHGEVRGEAGTPQSTYIKRVPQCMSPRHNWELGLSHPLSRQQVCPSPRNQRGGGAHSPAGEGLGESQFRRLEKKFSTLPTLWGTQPLSRSNWCFSCNGWTFIVTVEPVMHIIIHTSILHRTLICCLMPAVSYLRFN